MPPSRHDQVVKAVEKELRRFTREVLQGALLEGCLQLWQDFAATIDLGRTRKPETWAAALYYTFDRLQMGNLTQEDVANLYRVSALSVSQKFQQFCQALDLVLFDRRYLPEARRMNFIREFGSLSEHIPLQEASHFFWHRPLAFRTEDPLFEAQEMVYNGWESLVEDTDEAELYFQEALERDPYLADAYNGLANVAIDRDDWKTAEAHYKKACELARDSLGSESPDAYYWWGELETRPYMRARQGLGWVYWQTGRIPEAIAEYESLLRLNPNDNQGVRFVIPLLYQLAGDLNGALKAYEAYDKNYPDDWGDPHLTFSQGLALYEAGRPDEAVAAWRKAIFDNIYLTPKLVGEPEPEIEVWHSTNLAMPEFAEGYLDLYGELWNRALEARRVLHRLWRDETMQADVKRWLEIGHALHVRRERDDFSDPGKHEEWLQLIHEQSAIEERDASPALIQRVLERAA